MKENNKKNKILLTEEANNPMNSLNLKT